MPDSPIGFFHEMSVEALAHPDVATGTMMGFPCLRVAGIPAHGNQRSEWDAGCRFDHPNPEHR